MGYSLEISNKNKTINNCAFLVFHEVLLFDTLGNEIALRGTCKVDLYFGAGEPDDYDDHTIEVEAAEICYDYTVPTEENKNPFNQWYSVANLESELKPKNEALLEEIKQQVLEYAYEHQESEVEF